MSAQNRLPEIVAPPPTGARPDWSRVAMEWGFRPPVDYVQIVGTYGRGLFVDEVNVWLPDAEREPRACSARDELWQSRDWIAANDLAWTHPGGATTPIVLGDERSAFEPWGSGSSGSYGYWHRIGDDADSWPVLYTDLSSLWLYHPNGIASFLVDLLDGAYPTELVDGVPGEVPDAAPYFRPASAEIGLV